MKRCNDDLHLSELDLKKVSSYYAIHTKCLQEKENFKEYTQNSRITVSFMYLMVKCVPTCINSHIMSFNHILRFFLAISFKTPSHHTIFLISQYKRPALHFFYSNLSYANPSKFNAHPYIKHGKSFSFSLTPHKILQKKTFSILQGTHTSTKKIHITTLSYTNKLRKLQKKTFFIPEILSK